MHFPLAIAMLATAVVSGAAASQFQCPMPMSYSSWTKACSCPPGQTFDAKAKACLGEEIKGAWPKPTSAVYAARDVKMAAFCAASPYKIVRYDASHEYCQASLDTIAFLADDEIEVELEVLGTEVEVEIERLGEEIEVEVGGVEIEIELPIISEVRKGVTAALAGLYLKNADDAVKLFNTDTYGLATTSSDLLTPPAASGGLLNQLKSVTCAAGLSSCKYDCVSYAAKGCRNFIDVPGSLGGHMAGMNGFAVFPDVVMFGSDGNNMDTLDVEGLVCTVANIFHNVAKVFNYHCL